MFYLQVEFQSGNERQKFGDNHIIVVIFQTLDSLDKNATIKGGKSTACSR
jgi:hypothetical protein